MCVKKVDSDAIMGAGLPMVVTAAEVILGSTATVYGASNNAKAAVEIGGSSLRAGITEIGKFGISTMAGEVTTDKVTEWTGSEALGIIAGMGTSSLSYGALSAVDYKMNISGLHGTGGNTRIGNVTGSGKGGSGSIGEGVESGSGSVKYSPINPCNDISQEVAESFNGATFTKTTLTEDTVMYRVSGGKAGEVGSYVSRTPQGGGLQSQLDLALNPSWGNTTENITKVVVPKGITIYEGVAAPQNIYDSLGNIIGVLPGGGNQVYIPKVEAGWFK